MRFSTLAVIWTISAAVALCQAGIDAGDQPSIPMLIRQLKDKNLAKRQQAIKATIDLRNDAKPAVPDLIEVL